MRDWFFCSLLLALAVPVLACATSRPVLGGCVHPCTPEGAVDATAELLAGAGNDHDFPTRLAYLGDARAVPGIIAVLERHPQEADGQTMICTRAHALAALRTLTGVNVGITTDAWHQWWAEHGAELLAAQAKKSGAK